MPQKRKAAMLLPEACPQAEATPSPPLPARAEPLYSPAQMLELISRLTNEKGLTPQRENYIKLNCMSRPSQKSVPWLSLSGRWLQNAGFVPCEYAKTIAYNGMLIVIPGINPPVVNRHDVRHLNTLLQKLTNYVHTQK